MVNESAEQSRFDALIHSSLQRDESSQREDDAGRTAARFGITWGVAALTSLFVAHGSFMLATTISEARSFGWPATRPTDQLAQMNLDETLLGLPLFGLPTALLVVIYVSSLFFVARGHRVAGWLLPSLMVIAVGIAPIAWASML